MATDLMLYPDTYEFAIGPSGVPIMKATGFVFGLDSNDRLVATKSDKRIIANTYLKILMTRKGSSMTSPTEGTILPDAINYPQGSPQFEGDIIAAVLDAEAQTKKLLSGLQSPVNITLKKASIVELDQTLGKISIELSTSDGDTAAVLVPSKRL
jgi:hypothetical protein